MGRYLDFRKEEVMIGLHKITGEDYLWMEKELTDIEKENNYSYQLIPFIEFINENILCGIRIEKGSMKEWWNLYSNTLFYNGEALRYALKDTSSEILDQYNQIFSVERNIKKRLIEWLKQIFFHHKIGLIFLIVFYYINL